MSEIVLKNDSTTSNADDENINDSTTYDEVFYDPEPFMGCPCGKKYFSDIPYKKHMATFHPLTNSPKKDTSYTEEQIKTLNVDKDLDISNIYPNIIEDPNNSNGIEQLVSDPMLTGSAITDFLSTKSVEYSVGYESDATTIDLPVELEVEVEENKNVSLLIIIFLPLHKTSCIQVDRTNMSIYQTFHIDFYYVKIDKRIIEVLYKFKKCIKQFSIMKVFFLYNK